MNGEMKSGAGNVKPTLKKMSAYNDPNAVHYTWDSKTEEEKEQARFNIGAAAAKDVEYLKSYVTPQMFGAIGDGVTDDSHAFQLMFDYGGLINIPRGTYRLNTGVTITKKVNITSNNAVINGYTDDYVIKYALTSEHRQMFVENVIINQWGNGDCVLLESGGYLTTFTIRNTSFTTDYNGGGGYCININNCLSHSLIEMCTFSGKGIRAKCYDANLISKCMFFGNAVGIEYDIEYGVFNNAVRDCTIVNTKVGVMIIKGSQIIIENNQFEFNGISLQTGDYEGLVYVGTESLCEGVIIEKNNFGGGAFLNTNIILNHATNCVIAKNRLTSANECEIWLSANSYANIIENDNIGISTESNPRTDKSIKYIVKDSGTGNIGVYKRVNLTVDDVTFGTLTLLKDKNNIVHFTSCQLNENAVAGRVIGYLPLCFRPVDNVELTAHTPTGNVNVVVSYDGGIKFNDIGARYSIFIEDMIVSRFIY